MHKAGNDRQNLVSGRYLVEVHESSDEVEKDQVRRRSCVQNQLFVLILGSNWQGCRSFLRGSRCSVRAGDGHAKEELANGLWWSRKNERDSLEHDSLGLEPVHQTVLAGLSANTTARKSAFIMQCTIHMGLKGLTSSSFRRTER